MNELKKTKREISPDPVYNSVRVSKFVNHIMRKGKKAKARKIVHQAFDIIKEKTKKEPLEVLDMAIGNASPRLEVRAKRIGGATYQVPIEINENRRETLAMRWIISGARQKKGNPMEQRLAKEIMDAANNSGEAIRKKENLHKLAEANKAFSHFAY